MLNLRLVRASSRSMTGLYDARLAPLALESMRKELEAKFLAMRRLTPGDFHAVKARMGFAEEAVGHEDLIRALRKEQVLKLDSNPRGMVNRKGIDQEPLSSS